MESGKLGLRGFWDLMVPSHQALSMADRKLSPEDVKGGLKIISFVLLNVGYWLNQEYY